MKIYGIIILSDNTVVSTAYNVDSFGFFQRRSIKEFMIFFSKVLIKKLEHGTKQSIQHEEYIIHTQMCNDGLAYIFFCDQEYPQRVAFMCINDLINDNQIHLDKAIIEWQDPAKIDKILKIKQDLDTTINIIHKTIDNVLERGQKLDQLVSMSDDLGHQSKLFYNAAKKSNSCCTIN